MKPEYQDKDYPDQTITWAYEEEIPAKPVLLDIQAGVRTNLMMNVFHLPHETADKWIEKLKPIIEDAARTTCQVETTVGFQVGQQHVADFLQKNCSQQQILFLASNQVYGMAKKLAEEAVQQLGPPPGLFGMLGQILNPNGGPDSDK